MIDRGSLVRTLRTIDGTCPRASGGRPGLQTAHRLWHCRCCLVDTPLRFSARALTRARRTDQRTKPTELTRMDQRGIRWGYSHRSFKDSKALKILSKIKWARERENGSDRASTLSALWIHFQKCEYSLFVNFTVMYIKKMHGGKKCQIARPAITTSNANGSGDALSKRRAGYNLIAEEAACSSTHNNKNNNNNEVGFSTLQSAVPHQLLRRSSSSCPSVAALQRWVPSRHSTPPRQPQNVLTNRDGDRRNEITR